MATIEEFKKLFPSLQPNEEAQKEIGKLVDAQRDLVSKIRGPDRYGEKKGGKALADVHADIDAMLMAWPDLQWQWGEMATTKVKKALDEVGHSIAVLKSRAKDAPFEPGPDGEPPEDLNMLRDLLAIDIDQLETLHEAEVQACEGRASKTTGDITVFSKQVPDGQDETGQPKFKRLLQGWNALTDQNEWHTEAEWTELKDKYGAVNKLTGNADGLLLEGWNAASKKIEKHTKEEWKHLDDRLGVDKPTETSSTPMHRLKEVTGTFDMSAKEPRQEAPTVSPFTKMETGKYGEVTKSGGGVMLQDTGNDFLGAYEVYNKWERQASRAMRENLSGSMNARVGPTAPPVLKKGVENNCAMAENLAGLLAPDPTIPGYDPKDMFKPGGLLCRAVGDTKNQGGFSKEPNADTPDPAKVIESIGNAAGRLKQGKGEPGDANMITQFMAAFVDGLTEITEGNKTAEKQLNMLWKKFARAFGLQDSDKDKLLERVKGYKEIAGGHADTLSGKGTRKFQTRAGRMPDDKQYKIEEEQALIGGDISGSMQSQLLAQELAESLMGDVNGTKGIKSPGEDVKVVDKTVLNARVLDAFAMTAGGEDPTKGDLVFHTGWEMLNGMRGITGLPPLDQMTANVIVRSMGKGTSFTDAVEAVLPPDKTSPKPYPWS